MAVIFYPGSGFTKDEDAEDGNINICLYIDSYAHAGWV